MDDELQNGPNAEASERGDALEAEAPAGIPAPSAPGPVAASLDEGARAGRPGSDGAGPAPALAGDSATLFSAVAAAPKPAPEPWRGRDLALFVGFTVLWYLLAQFLTLAGYAILSPVMGWQTPLVALDQNAVFAVVFQLIFYVPVLLYVFLLVVVRYRLPFWEGIRWRWPGGRRALRLFFGGIVLAVGLALASSLAPETKSFPLEKLLSSPLAAYALGAFAITVAPFMEELIFRGVLFSVFERSRGVWFAVGLTALLFGAMHVPEYWGAWTHVGMILVVGLVFSLTRAITGSLAPSVILHAAYNATLMIGLYIGTHHFHNLHNF